VDELTFSGRLNLGVASTNVTAPSDPNFGPGRPAQAFGAAYERGPGRTYVSQNGAAASFLRADLKVPLSKDVTLLGAAQTFFNPLSLRLTDNCKAQADQNGLPASQRGAGADSAVCGQPLNGDAYVGVSASKLGLTVTAGSQLSEASRIAARYDPLPGVNTSLLTWGGSTVSPNTSELTYWRRSLRIAEERGPYHVSAIYDPGSENQANHGRAIGVSAGVSGKIDPHGIPAQTLSTDVAYTDVSTALSAAPLAGGVPAGFPKESLAGTAFRARAVMLGVSDQLDLGNKGKVTVFAGGQYAKIGKPDNQVVPGDTTVGGYTLATVASANPGQNVTGWAGAKWTIGRFTTAAAFYDFKKQSGTTEGHTHVESLGFGYAFNDQLRVQLALAESSASGSLASPTKRAVTVDFVWTPKLEIHHKR
jgi:hypothetical protein